MQLKRFGAIALVLMLGVGAYSWSDLMLMAVFHDTQLRLERPLRATGERYQP